MFDKKMYIGGKKVEGEKGSLEVINPFNGKVVELFLEPLKDRSIKQWKLQKISNLN